MAGDVRRLSTIAAIWALWYAIYRCYYAFGGTWFLPGTVVKPGLFRLVNGAGTLILLLGSATPLVMRPLWPSPRLRRVLLSVCWIIAVGCVMHGIIDITQRILSLAGALDVPYGSSIWKPDPRAADWQDIAFNEPWFLLEGGLFAALAWLNLTHAGRRTWLVTAAIATAVLTAFGLLSTFGIIGTAIVL